MKRKAWNTNLRISLVLMVAATFGTTAWADGTHSTKFTVENNSGGIILVYTYNGKDTMCATPHKEYVIHNGGERTVKCHGEGTGKCKFRVYKGRSSFRTTTITDNVTCVAEESNSYGWDKADRGDTCTITGRSPGDYSCS